MRPVTGGDRKGDRQSEQANDNLTKRDADRASKVRRDSDSSEETQSDGDSGKSSKSSLKLKIKQWPKERPVSVAPHSTTKAKAADTFSSSKPIIRASQKRDDYQSAVVRDKMLGEKGPYRRRETDLQLDYPELKSLQLAKFKRELIQRSNSAGGYLEVEVKDKKDIDLLAAVLIENPSIHSLKLISDFGGRYLDKLLASFDLNFSTNGAERPSKLDEKSFRTLLSACKNLHDLNLSACRLTNQNWIDLADGLSIFSNLKRLSLGGGDFLFLQGAKALYLSFESNNSSLRELYVDGLNFGDYALLRFVKAIEAYKNFRKISLTNMNFGTSKSAVVTIFEFCAGNPKLQYLSLGGAIFSNSDKLFRFYKPSSIDGRSISMVQSTVKAHKCLVALDLAGCDMTDAEMSQLITCIKDSSSLVELRTASNTIAEHDRSKLTAMTTRNRRNLEMRAAAALSLMIGNASSRIDIWPQELTGVLVENAPLDALLDIAAVIDDRLDSVATDSDSSSVDGGNSTDSGSSRVESSDSIAERSE